MRIKTKKQRFVGQYCADEQNEVWKEVFIILRDAKII